jgi:hypothetical protein
LMNIGRGLRRKRRVNKHFLTETPRLERLLYWLKHFSSKENSGYGRS